MAFWGRDGELSIAHMEAEAGGQGTLSRGTAGRYERAQ